MYKSLSASIVYIEMQKLDNLCNFVVSDYYAVNDPVFGSLMFGSLIQCLGPGVLQSEYCLVMFSSKLLIHCKFRPLCIA
ncbi:hypothetical protein X798_00884 [Onchocerca flexuosa]|uniref:Uncharacterized protein n=1 Tax=Onchocerca flexuosa TaxID=387005 RepID=A0A238C4G6_9BILA|nr:hypothetical protein X798_00884 [Onchocerca flexuosa]